MIPIVLFTTSLHILRESVTAQLDGTRNGGHLAIVTRILRFARHEHVFASGYMLYL